MKIYRMFIGVRILGVLMCVVFMSLGLYSLLFDMNRPFLIGIFAFGCVLMGFLGIFAFLLSKIQINDQQLNLMGDFILFRTQQVVLWSNIKEISADYFFIPQFCILRIIFLEGSIIKKFEIQIRSYPHELSREILNRIPDGIEIQLYPWLRRSLIKKFPELKTTLRDQKKFRR